MKLILSAFLFSFAVVCSFAVSALAEESVKEEATGKKAKRKVLD